MKNQGTPWLTRKEWQERARVVASMAVLSMLVLWTYRYGLIDFPRHDQVAFDLERTHFHGAGEWFWHVLSYNRTRLNGQGDELLFRPGLHAVLAAEDLFMDPRSRGVLSVVMH